MQDRDEAVFRQKTLLRDDVIRQIQVIGEATKRLSRGLRARYRHLPWQVIAGMCDKLIQDYFGVDNDQVWLTAREDLLLLKVEVEKILAALTVD